jgi:hypothetical protein
MVRLATDHFKNHTLQAVSPASLYDRELWRIHDATQNWTNAVEIQAVGFGRLLVHGSCDPVVFGNYKHHPEPAKHHDIIHLIGEREWQYMEYVTGKTIPRMPDYYDEKKANEDLEALRKDLAELPLDRDGPLFQLAELQDRINNQDWHRVHAYLYEELEVEAEDIGRFGRVMAPPNFYYVVGAVKRLWELLEVHDG